MILAAEFGPKAFEESRWVHHIRLPVRFGFSFYISFEESLWKGLYALFLFFSFNSMVFFNWL